MLMQFDGLQANRLLHRYLKMGRNIILERWLLINMEKYPLFACNI